MEKVKNVVIAVILLSLVCFHGIIVSAQVHLEKNLDGSLGSILKEAHSGFSEAECPGACTYRCSRTAYKKPCMFFCQKCCFKCRCVPPGTYGHKQVCPCYNNWKTKRGGPKCP
ncbi:hypothetical protein Pfo_017876 [Paulownia fortunei]|nr:hypothetical protein Pfo_017876 [Paulownia fortunei]